MLMVDIHFLISHQLTKYTKLYQITRDLISNSTGTFLTFGPLLVPPSSIFVHNLTLLMQSRKRYLVSLLHYDGSIYALSPNDSMIRGNGEIQNDIWADGVDMKNEQI